MRARCCDDLSSMRRKEKRSRGDDKSPQMRRCCHLIFFFSFSNWAQSGRSMMLLSICLSLLKSSCLPLFSDVFIRVFRGRWNFCTYRVTFSRVPMGVRTCLFTSRNTLIDMFSWNKRSTVNRNNCNSPPPPFNRIPFNDAFLLRGAVWMKMTKKNNNPSTWFMHHNLICFLILLNCCIFPNRSKATVLHKNDFWLKIHSYYCKISKNALIRIQKCKLYKTASYLLIIR